MKMSRTVCLFFGVLAQWEGSSRITNANLKLFRTGVPGRDQNVEETTEGFHHCTKKTTLKGQRPHLNQGVCFLCRTCLKMY